jgi:hypothetical protein
MANSSINNKKHLKGVRDNFLEAFRGIGGGVVSDAKQAILGGSNSTSGSEYTSSSDIYRSEADLENKYRQQWLRSEQIRRSEQVLYTRRQKETEQHVIQLQQEIKGLAKATGDLARQVDISAMQVSTDAPASIYHLNFFEHLKRFVRQLKTQINDSAVWLAEFNKKSKKRNAYWGGVKKQGAKFLLSQDRYVATQAG